MADYDAAQHHDLGSIVEIRTTTAIRFRYLATCACGEPLPEQPNRTAAFASWQMHHEQAVFG